MPVLERIAEVADALDRAGGAQAVAAEAVIRWLGWLPAGIHLRVARFVYGGRFFSMIASVLPGSRRERTVFGRTVRAVYPVLPLADRVGLAVGFLSWGDVLGIGVTADTDRYRAPAELAELVAGVFGEVAGSATGPVAGTSGGAEPR
jgi:hypothetical protein